MIERWRVAVAVSAVVVAAIACGVGAKHAPGGTMTRACGHPLYERPFLPWLDPAYYVLAPDGGLEGGGALWTLSGGAAVVSGNETHYVRGAADTRSLSLPSGSSAKTHPMCVGVDAPVARAFVSNTGSVLSTLQVDVVYRNVLGLTVTAPVATLTGTSTWRPTPPLAFLANVASLNLATNGTTDVSFRFTPRGSSSGWRVDDLYVDPYKGS